MTVAVAIAFVALRATGDEEEHIVRLEVVMEEGVGRLRVQTLLLITLYLHYMNLIVTCMELVAVTLNNNFFFFQIHFISNHLNLIQQIYISRSHYKFVR